MNFILDLLNLDGLCCYIGFMLGHHHFSSFFLEATGFSGNYMKLSDLQEQEWLFLVDVNEGAGTVTICAEKVGVPGTDITCARDEEKEQSLFALTPICFDILSFDIPPF